jgi:hypothetical protein
MWGCPFPGIRVRTAVLLERFGFIDQRIERRLERNPVSKLGRVCPVRVPDIGWQKGSRAAGSAPMRRLFRPANDCPLRKSTKDEALRDFVTERAES